MATPTTISQSNTNATSTRINFTLTNATVVTVRLRFTPKVYTDFYEDVTQSVNAGTNVTHNFVLTWDSSLSFLMRGITYKLSMRTESDNSTSEWVNTDVEVVKPFPTLSSGDYLTPGFTISGISIPANRTTDKIFSTDEIDYKGTWNTYPKITVTGRFTYVLLVNTATGAQIGIDAIVPSSSIRVINTDPRSAQYGIYGGSNTNNLSNAIHEATDDTDIRNFYFPASNELVRPLAIETYIFHRDANTDVSIEYITKMYGF